MVVVGTVVMAMEIADHAPRYEMRDLGIPLLDRIIQLEIDLRKRE